MNKRCMVCSKCGKGETYNYRGKTFEGVTLFAIREGAGFSQVSGKYHKGEVTGYICDGCKK